MNNNLLNSFRCPKINNRHYGNIVSNCKNNKNKKNNVNSQNWIYNITKKKNWEVKCIKSAVENHKRWASELWERKWEKRYAIIDRSRSPKKSSISHSNRVNSTVFFSGKFCVLFLWDSENIFFWVGCEWRERVAIFLLLRVVCFFPWMFHFYFLLFTRFELNIV